MPPFPEHLEADVIVVGASPAGLRAAWAAAREGASVVLLEAREEIGVPEPLAALAFDALWTAEAHAPPEAVRSRLEGLRVQTPGGATVTVEAAARVLDRTRFDRHLAQEAQAQGATLRLGVRQLTIAGSGHLQAEGLSVHGRALLFADGARSLAHRLLTPYRDPTALLWGAAHEVRAPWAETTRFAALQVGSHAPGGRTQLTPAGGDRWLHWTFVRGSAEETRAAAEAAVARLHAEEVTFRGLGVDPVLTIPHELVGDGLLVAGGAAGQGGLEAGLAAGEAAGRVAGRAALAAPPGGVVRAAALRPYEREWKREFLPGYLRLRSVLDHLARLSDAQLDALAAPWNGRRIPAATVQGLSHRVAAVRALTAAGALARNPRAVLPFLRLALPALGEPEGVRELTRKQEA